MRHKGWFLATMMLVTLLVPLFFSSSQPSSQPSGIDGPGGKDRSRFAPVSSGSSTLAGQGRIGTSIPTLYHEDYSDGGWNDTGGITIASVSNPNSTGGLTVGVGSASIEADESASVDALDLTSDFTYGGMAMNTNVSATWFNNSIAGDTNVAYTPNGDGVLYPSGSDMELMVDNSIGDLPSIRMEFDSHSPSHNAMVSMQLYISDSSSVDFTYFSISISSHNKPLAEIWLVQHDMGYIPTADNAIVVTNITSFVDTGLIFPVRQRFLLDIFISANGSYWVALDGVSGRHGESNFGTDNTAEIMFYSEFFYDTCFIDDICNNWSAMNQTFESFPAGYNIDNEPDWVAPGAFLVEWLVENVTAYNQLEFTTTSSVATNYTVQADYDIYGTDNGYFTVNGVDYLLNGTVAPGKRVVEDFETFFTFFSSGTGWSNYGGDNCDNSTIRHEISDFLTTAYGGIGTNSVKIEDTNSGANAEMKYALPGGCKSGYVGMDFYNIVDITSRGDATDLLDILLLDGNTTCAWLRMEVFTGEPEGPGVAPKLWVWNGTAWLDSGLILGDGMGGGGIIEDIRVTFDDDNTFTITQVQKFLLPPHDLVFTTTTSTYAFINNMTGGIDGIALLTNETADDTIIYIDDIYCSWDDHASGSETIAFTGTSLAISIYCVNVSLGISITVTSFDATIYTNVTVSNVTFTQLHPYYNNYHVNFTTNVSGTCQFSIIVGNETILHDLASNGTFSYNITGEAVAHGVTLTEITYPVISLLLSAIDNGSLLVMTDIIIFDNDVGLDIDGFYTRDSKLSMYRHYQQEGLVVFNGTDRNVDLFGTGVNLTIDGVLYYYSAIYNNGIRFNTTDNDVLFVINVMDAAGYYKIFNLTIDIFPLVIDLSTNQYSNDTAYFQDFLFYDFPENGSAAYPFVIEDLAIDCNDSTPGIFLSNIDCYLSITGITISNVNGTGIWLDNCTNIVIDDVSIDTVTTCDRVSGFWSWVWNGSLGWQHVYTVTTNITYYPGTGILVGNSTGITISNSEIASCEQHAIDLQNNTAVNCSGNTITCSAIGIHDDGTQDGLVIAGNYFMMNTADYLNTSTFVHAAPIVEYNYYHAYFDANPYDVTNSTSMELPADYTLTADVVDAHPLYDPAFFQRGDSVNIYFGSFWDNKGIDFDIAIVFIDGTSIVSHDFIPGHVIFHIRIEDLRGAVLWDEMHNINSTHDVKIMLDIIPVTVTNHFDTGVLFHYDIGSSTKTLPIGSGESITLRVSPGDFSYWVSDKDNATLDDAAGDPIAATMDITAPRTIDFGWTEISVLPLVDSASMMIVYMSISVIVGLAIGVPLAFAVRARYQVPRRATASYQSAYRVDRA